MRNLLTLTAILIFSFYSSIAQPLKVVGYSGDPYNLITKFNDDYFTVERNDGYALVRENYNNPALMIDSTGKIVTTFPKDRSYIDNATPPGGISGGDNPEYPFYISETLKQLVDHGKGIFSYGSSYGLIDRSGKTILECKYDHLSNYHNGKMFAHKSSFINNSTKHEYRILKDDGDWAIEIVPSEF